VSVFGALLAGLAGIVVTYSTWSLAHRNDDGPWLGWILGVLAAATVVAWDLGI